MTVDDFDRDDFLDDDDDFGRDDDFGLDDFGGEDEGFFDDGGTASASTGGGGGIMSFTASERLILGLFALLNGIAFIIIIVMLVT